MMIAQVTAVVLGALWRDAGLPMGAADYAFVLWSRFMKFDPADPLRDGFLL